MQRDGVEQYLTPHVNKRSSKCLKFYVFNHPKFEEILRSEMLIYLIADGYFSRILSSRFRLYRSAVSNNLTCSSKSAFPNTLKAMGVWAFL